MDTPPRRPAQIDPSQGPRRNGVQSYISQSPPIETPPRIQRSYPASANQPRSLPPSRSARRRKTRRSSRKNRRNRK